MSRLLTGNPNELAEGAVRDVKASVCTLTFDVAEQPERYGIEVKARHVLMPWLVRHASAAPNLGQKGADGCTPWERLRGKKYQKLMLPIAETVMFDTGVAPSRHEGRWRAGIFLGLADRNEFYLGIEDKVVTARSVRRLPPSENADSGLLGKIQGTPWQPTPGEIRIEPGVIDGGPEVEPGDGYTAHCPGCEAARLDLTPRGHSEACRQRIERAMEATGSGQDRLRATKAKVDIREGVTLGKRIGEGVSVCRFLPEVPGPTFC
eukprot:1597769-Amphidinium_carterae.2